MEQLALAGFNSTGLTSCCCGKLLHMACKEVHLVVIFFFNFVLSSKTEKQLSSMEADSVLFSCLHGSRYLGSRTSPATWRHS